MDWQKILSSLLIIILFIPMVFMGANVFFPDYDDYYESKRCVSIPRIADATTEEMAEIEKENQECWEENNAEREKWEDAKRIYDGQKYVFIIIVCLIALIASLLIPLKSNVKWGFFVGAVITAFIGTIAYLRTKSLIGFIILVILFILVIIFISKQKQK